jgi:thioredoxin-dependent peroxiredoxin
MREEKTIAPEFVLPDQEGKEHALSQYRGQWVLVYFYPKDDTPGCTKEACMIRDNWTEFKKLGIVVLGISKDSPKSHKKFVEKYDLPFTLLSDEDTKVMQQYEVWATKKFMGREYLGTLRASYLIDPQGSIARVYKKVEPAGHADEVLADLQALR